MKSKLFNTQITGTAATAAWAVGLPIRFQVIRVGSESRDLPGNLNHNPIVVTDQSAPS